MAVQEDVNLNEPLKVENRNTLERVNLTPNRAQAALNLHGDYYKQQLSLCNRYIFWHPISMSFFAFGTFIYMFSQLKKFIFNYQVGSSLVKMFFQDRDFQFHVFMLLPGMVAFTGIVALFAFILTDDFQRTADNLDGQDYINEIFGFNLKNYAKLPANKEEIQQSTNEIKRLAANGDNTTLIIYRSSPIAIATVKALPEHSEDGTFFVKITGLHVRKVFAAVDFDNLLLEWARDRAVELYKNALKDKKLKKNISKVTILIDTYSFNKKMINALNGQFFTKVGSTYAINPFQKIDNAAQAYNNNATNGVSASLKKMALENINKAFGIQKVTFALSLAPSPSEKVETIKSKATTSQVKRRN